MSATVVEVPSAVSVHGDMSHCETRVESPAHSSGGTDGGEPLAEVMLASEQLCHLASLHHHSDYSLMKYGSKGASSIYVPMSIHVPRHVEHLKILQASCITQRAWWLSSNVPSVRPERSCQPQTEPIMTRIGHPTDLREDLHAALTSPLDTRPRIPPRKHDPQPLLRTSDTHPINISAMIPSELLHIISSNLTRADQDLPVIFDVPLSWQLHRLLFRSHELRRSYSPPDALPLPTPRPDTTLLPQNLVTPSKPSGLVNLLWTQAFLRKGIISSALVNGGSKSFSTLRHSLVMSNPASIGECRPTNIRQAPDFTPDTPSRCDPVPRSNTSATNKASSINSHLTRASTVPYIKYRRAVHLTLGNLLLSSCPGKKVRLNGPVKGRGAVRRDLKQDLGRMSEMGVRCIICCLDDSELEFLGAPWNEYSRIADELGLDVLRIPIPEGLVPLDIEAFDAHLTRLMDTYTLTGRHVLVHCRGGVGRAGLIACCWMMKLGLCGWAEGESTAGNASSPANIPLGPVRNDTLHLVQRVLNVVRKQRSPKAIETFEQVHFLVAYADYLRDSARTSAFVEQTHDDDRTHTV